MILRSFKVGVIGASQWTTPFCVSKSFWFFFSPSLLLWRKVLEVQPIFAAPWPAALCAHTCSSDILHPSTRSQWQKKPSSGPADSTDGPEATLWSACGCSNLEFLLAVIYKYLFLSQIFRLWLYLPSITNTRNCVLVLVLLPAVVFVTDGN